MSKEVEEKSKDAEVQASNEGPGWLCLAFCLSSRILRTAAQLIRTFKC